MARRKKSREIDIVRPAGGLVVGATILGFGAQTATKAGGSGAGISAAAGFLPALGTTIGAGLTLGAVRNLEPERRRKRKK